MYNRYYLESHVESLKKEYPIKFTFLKLGLPTSNENNIQKSL